MDPLTLALLGYPLSMFASFTYDQIKKVKNNYQNIDALNDVFIKSFYKALDFHIKFYDEFAAAELKKIKRIIKADEGKLLSAISIKDETILSAFNKKAYHKKIADQLIFDFSLDDNDDNEMLNNIISNSFKFYIQSFFQTMNEKEGIQAILLESLKINNVIEKINNKLISKEEYDIVRNGVLTKYYTENIDKLKQIEDYDAYLKNKFKYLELRGFSPKISGKEVHMELLDVFVPLDISREKKIVPSIYHTESESSNSNEINSLSILEKSSIVILGDPGSGKSTLLKYLSVNVSELRSTNHNLKNTIPVFIKLSEYSTFLNSTGKSLYEYITEYSDIQYKYLFKENFEYSNLLILLDGMDEITNTSLRLRVSEQVMDTIARYPFNKYIVTSRVVGYQESKLGGDFIHYKLLPFREKEVELFAKQWYKSIAGNTDKNYEFAEEQANSLFCSISRNPSVIKLATNPLLMTIIAMIHYQGKKLPSKRIELYEISTDTFLEHWVHLRLLDESQLKDKSEILEILAPIAFDIHETKSDALIEEREFKENFLRIFQEIHTNSTLSSAKKICAEFIQFLRQQTGFFYEKGIDDDGNRFFGFMHLTFEEYLASIELVSRWSENSIKLEDYIFQARWTEIIRLSASQIRMSFKGKAGRTQTSNFVLDILQVQDEFPDAFRPLQLACLIVSDDVGINDSLFNDIIDKLFNILSNFEYYPLINSVSNIFKELLLSERQKSFVERIKIAIGDDNPILHNNLIKILVNNADNEEIENLIVENINVGGIRAGILKYIRKDNNLNKDFIQLEFNNWLCLKESDTITELDKNTIRKFIHTTTGIGSLSKLTEIQVKLIKANLKKYKKNKHYTLILKVFIEMILINMSEYGIALLNDLEKESSLPFLKDLLISVNNQYDELSKISGSSTSWIDLISYEGILKLSNKIIHLYFWDKEFSEVSYKKLLVSDYSTQLKYLEGILNETELERLKIDIHFILGPQNTTDDLDKYVKSYLSEHKKIFDFFGWEDFPLLNIQKDPKLLSKIILDNSLRYLNDSGFKPYLFKQLDKDILPNKDILAPIKLLIYKRMKQPYNNDILKKTLEYYNNCEQQEKEGVFNILYNILNPIISTDDNIL